jgi:hypothetical protein
MTTDEARTALEGIAESLTQYEAHRPSRPLRQILSDLEAVIARISADAVPDADRLDPFEALRACGTYFKEALEVTDSPGTRQTLEGMADIVARALVTPVPTLDARTALAAVVAALNDPDPLPVLRLPIWAGLDGRIWQDDGDGLDLESAALVCRAVNALARLSADPVPVEATPERMLEAGAIGLVEWLDQIPLAAIAMLRAALPQAEAGAENLPSGGPVSIAEQPGANTQPLVSAAER